jgi:hypothetical protein
VKTLGVKQLFQSVSTLAKEFSTRVDEVESEIDEVGEFHRGFGTGDGKYEIIICLKRK